MEGWRFSKKSETERVQGFKDLEKKGFKDSRSRGFKWFSWNLFSKPKEARSQKSQGWLTIYTSKHLNF
ncbi:MAG: hypothetical protein KBH82_05765 [Syntrophorhabdaceae bacterium]|nr:hypothetical protein [Syntrophorhabdaceae bacterium]